MPAPQADTGTARAHPELFAEAALRLDQHVECLGRQTLHLAQERIFQPWPPAHEAGRYIRTASSSSMPLPTGARAASIASR